jgi:seryl-tRNA synthetase
MLDIKYLRENLEEAIQRLETRNKDFSYLREIPVLDSTRRELIKEVETKKALRNEKSKEIGKLKREKQDATPVLKLVENIGDEIKELDKKIAEIDEKIKEILLITPNLPNKEVCIGVDEKDNKEIRKFSIPREFDFEIKDHTTLGENLDILDFQRATKITGPRFVIYKGLGARLERSLIQFMMDLHSLEHGYRECMPPYIVNTDSMYATGQYPKFKEDSFRLIGDENYVLNPTAEVPTINMYRDEIIDNDKLPLKFCSYTTAFRSEAGSAGRDTRGILRQHQFNKVELIKFTRPEDSYNELEEMLKNSERVLQLLNLPYRVVELCTGDMGFGMAKTYDIEVWVPSQNTYREIGSISNAEDYQARRGNIRFKRTKDSKTEYVHTLNGSGLAVGRTVIAIMENYQNADGTITVPEVLRKYMNVDIIK